MSVKFSIQQKSNTEASLYIYGAIGIDNEKPYEDGTNNIAINVIRQLDRLAETNSRINVHLNGPGGYIDEGLAIHNKILSLPNDTHTYCDGFVGSMTGVIMLAGKTTHFPKTSVMHIHRAIGGCLGNVNQLQDAIDQILVFESTLKTAIARKTKLSIEEIEALWFDGKDHFMTGEEAHKYGFVDVLEDYEPKLPVNIVQMKAMPYQRIAAMFNEPAEKSENILQKLISKIESLLNPAPQSHENNHSNSNNNQKMNSLKSSVRLLALMAISEIALNAEAKAELTVDQIMTIEDKLSSFENSLSSLTAQVAAKEKENADRVADIAARDAQILDLQNQIKDLNANTPADGAQNPKATDTTPASQGSEGNWNPAVSAKLRDFNKKNLIS